jgi:predicted RNA binding protein YcfA (HicA-like mRNA interferase family)
MPRPDDLLERVLRGGSDSNISFFALRALHLRLGFTERIHGSHHIFRRPGARGILNLQRHGHEAKPYQVRQVRRRLLLQGFRWSE